MKSTRKIFSSAPLLVFFIAGLSTNWTKPYLCLGPIGYPGIALGLVLGLAGSAWFFVFDGHRGTSRTVVIVLNLLIITSAIGASIYSFAPFLNAALDFGPATTITGTVREIEYTSTSRNSRPTRTVTAFVNGREREVSFRPYRYYWNVAAVRNGGPVTLTVRPGLFGIPWIEKFSDP